MPPRRGGLRHPSSQCRHRLPNCPRPHDSIHTPRRAPPARDLRRGPLPATSVASRWAPHQADPPISLVSPPRPRASPTLLRTWGPGSYTAARPRIGHARPGRDIPAVCRGRRRPGCLGEDARARRPPGRARGRPRRRWRRRLATAVGPHSRYHDDIPSLQTPPLLFSPLDSFVFPHDFDFASLSRSPLSVH